MWTKTFLSAALALALIGPTREAGKAEDAGPIKVAFLAIDSGPFAASMQDNINGMKLAIDYINDQGGANARKFQLVLETGDGTPSSAIVAATRAVQQDGAQFILGMFSSSIAAALVPKANALGVLVIDPWSQSDDLIGKGCGPNYFRTSTSNSMIVNAVKTFVKQTAILNWDAISVDYTSGHDLSAKFKQFLSDIGGKLVANLFAPLGTSDFGSYISQLSATPSEGLLVTIFGTDSAAFAKQQAQFALFKKYKLVLGNGFTTPPTIGGEGDFVLGVYETLSYHFSLSNPKNEAFVKVYRDRYKANPDYIDADMYVALELLRAAIDNARSTEVSAVRAALSGLKANTIYGDVELRAADHQLVRQELLTQVVRDEDGKLTFAIKANLDGPSIMPAPNPLCKE